VLREAADSGHALALFEAPHRIAATTQALADALPARRVIVARELTKKFETICEMMAADLPAWVAQSEPRGEYVLLVDAVVGPAPGPAQPLDASTRRLLDALAAELPASRAAAVVARLTGLPRDLLYATLATKASD
jgi:16S rRNA (cytidine1402-2'-O)-methyltransferase